MSHRYYCLLTNTDTFFVLQQPTAYEAHQMHSSKNIERGESSKHNRSPKLETSPHCSGSKTHRHSKSPHNSESSKLIKHRKRQTSQCRHAGEGSKQNKSHTVSPMQSRCIQRVNAPCCQLNKVSRCKYIMVSLYLNCISA